MTFDASAHEYRDGETIIRSVTQILSDAGVIDYKWSNREAMERGSAVHELAERYAQGIREDKKGRAIDGLEWVKPFAEWMAVSGAYALETEAMVSGLINGHRYAGRFDLLALINGKRVLVDIKTGGGAKWHPAQLAAYSMARFDSTGEPVNPDSCMILYLQRDSYREAYIPSSELVEGIQTFKEAIAI